MREETLPFTENGAVPLKSTAQFSVKGKYGNVLNRMGFLTFCLNLSLMQIIESDWRITLCREREQYAQNITTLTASNCNSAASWLENFESFGYLNFLM